MRPEEVRQRIEQLLFTPDPAVVEQALELMTIMPVPGLITELAEGVYLDGSFRPSIQRGSLILQQRKPMLRMRIAMWLLRKSGALDGVECLVLGEPGLASREAFSAVEGLVELEELFLGDATGLSDLAPLSTLSGLRRLHLGRVRKVDLTALTALKDLEHLSLRGYNSAGLSALSDFSALRSLSLTGFTSPDQEALRVLTRLEALSLSGSLSGLNWLTELPCLQDLTLSRAAPAVPIDLSVISALTSLKRLVITDHSQNGSSDLSPLAGLVALKELRVPAVEGLTFAPIHGLKNLRILGLTGARFQFVTRRIGDIYRSLKPMIGLLRGVGLSPDGEPIRDGEALMGQDLLFVLHVGTPSLPGHPLNGVRRMTLTTDGVLEADLSPLAGLVSLETLDLRGRRRVNLTPLALMPNLQSLTGQQTVSGLAIRKLQQRLAHTFRNQTRYHRTARDELWLEQMLALGLLGRRHQSSGDPLVIARLLSSNRITDVLAGFETLAGLNETILVREYASGIDIEPDGRLTLSPAAIRKPFLRRKDRRTFCALMALRAAGGLQDVERIALGSRQPLYSLDPLDGLAHLTTLRLGGGVKLTDLSALTRMPALKTLDLRSCKRLHYEQRRLWDGEELRSLLRAIRRSGP